MKRWLLLGALAPLALALPVLFALRPSPAAPPAWPVSPRSAEPVRWDEPARAALTRLRRTTIAEARRVERGLAACEATGRNRGYRRCATPLLARTTGFAKANGAVLSDLAGTADRGCASRVLRLSGSASSLAVAADATLRAGLDAPWAELLTASRGIRALARETLRIARRPGWRATCEVRPEPAGTL